ncbi:MAG: hypothetical protein EXS05_06190 [Planctomycetaceae bacterium]|nr:hypothetical protein [Planctomycetaceae bacterium]
MLLHGRWMAVLLAVYAPVGAADNARHIDLGPGLTAVTTLEQNWSDKVSNWFYNVPQGSRLVPYDWFLHLEQAESQVPFRDANHLRALGYIPRTPDPLNPDGLPIGFIQDEPFEDETTGLGITCAACHTSQINFKGTAYLIDGGPALGDFERLLKELAAALKATAEQDAKFARFAATILPAGAPDDDKTALRTSLRSMAGRRADYNKRNLPLTEKDRFGPGRVDAFGAIFNEVSVTFLGMPQNLQAANAPVSYPCLWDAPRHDRVQWNGAAKNQVSPLGQLLFGTTEVGALGRNSGEVLGVFGSAEINAHELLPRRYSSTVNKDNLLEIEAALTSLWSPKWPRSVPGNAALGNIDDAMSARGEVIYKDNCLTCHELIDRKATDHKFKARLSDEGTDQSLIRNFGRQAQTGRLKGRRKTLLGFERFGENDATGVILKHVVERVILDPALNPRRIQFALVEEAANEGTPLERIDALNPGYQMTATIEVGDIKLVGQFDSLVKDGPSLTIDGGRFHLMAKGRNVLIEGLGKDLVDLRSRTSVQEAAARLVNVITADAPDGADDIAEQSKARLSNAVAKVGYKARPLNGVWATAPYLHNGSVPNLVELLKPAAKRVKSFHVGSREFDRENVGFKDDPSQPLFDTAVGGNANTGHKYGGSLSHDDRRDLLEYLKSL